MVASADQSAMPKSASTENRRSTRLELKLDASKSCGVRLAGCKSMFSEMSEYESEKLMGTDKGRVRRGKSQKEDCSIKKATPSSAVSSNRQMCGETSIKTRSRQFFDQRPWPVRKRSPRLTVSCSYAKEYDHKATAKADQCSGINNGEQVVAFTAAEAAVGVQLKMSSKESELSPKKRKADSLDESKHLTQINHICWGIHHATVGKNDEKMNDADSFRAIILKRNKISEDEWIAVEGLCELANIPANLADLANNPELCTHAKIKSEVVSDELQSSASGLEVDECTSCKIADSSRLQKEEMKALLPCCKSVPELENNGFQSSRETLKKRSEPAKEVVPIAVASLESQSPQEKVYLTYKRRNKVEDRISRFLSSALARRWCAFEWFYSGVDAQWFEKNEFVEYLNYVKLDILPRRLTRSEWSIIRCALGRPRRLSDHFLKGEREKLYHHRESVRRSLAGKKAFSALPYPFLVGKKVLAYSASTREFHDGILLSIDHNICRVQFDWPEKRVENIMDINCMLLGPHVKFPSPIKIRDSITGPMSKLGIDCDDRKAKVLMAYNVLSSLEKTDESSDMLSHMIELLNSLLQEANSMVTNEFRERINRASSLETDCSLVDTDKPTTSTNVKLEVSDLKPVVLGASKHIPVDLISSCLATLMMIQNCSEHKDPPEEEVKKLHLALRSLHPGCPENLPLYQQVKQLMEIIKSQLLTLVPPFSE